MPTTGSGLALDSAWARRIARRGGALTLPRKDIVTGNSPTNDLQASVFLDWFLAVPIRADLSITEALDTLAADGALGAITRLADLAATEAADVLASSAAAAIAGALARTESADTTAAAASNQVAALLAAVEAGDAFTASASATGGAVLGATEASDGLLMVGTVPVAAVLSFVEAADALDASGSVQGASRTAALAVTEGTDTLLAVCVVVVAGASHGHVQASERHAGEVKIRTSGPVPPRPEHTQRGTRWASRSLPRRR